MVEGINILEFGVFGGAFFLLFFIFMRFIGKVIDDNRIEMRLQREVFTGALNEMTKKLITIDVKLDSHINMSDRRQRAGRTNQEG